MVVEFFSNDQWHVFGGASVLQLESGVYAVTVSGLAAVWLANPHLFDGMLLRLDGREAKAIVGAKRKHDVLVLHAFVEKSSPGT